MVLVSHCKTASDLVPLALMSLQYDTKLSTISLMFLLLHIKSGLHNDCDLVLIGSNPASSACDNSVSSL